MINIRPNSPAVAPNVLFIGTEEDLSYTSMFKSCLTGAGKVHSWFKPIQYVAQATVLAKKAGVKSIITTSQPLLKALTGIQKDPTINDYAGSIFVRDGIEILIIDPLKQLITTPAGKFLTSRYVSKITRPHEWYDIPEFNWTMLSPDNAQEIFDLMDTAWLIGTDIETKQEPMLRIDCIGFTAMLPDLSTFTVVIEIKDMWSLHWMRKFCTELKPPKVLQNGTYDASYLTAWGCPLYNYLFDTISFMHCTYSELPKTLDFIAGFHIRNSMYWKDMADTGDRYEYFKYNALDTYYTVVSAAIWLMTAPGYAKINYLQEFPTVFPNHLCDMTGIKRDMERLEVVYTAKKAEVAAKQAKLEAMTVKGFNPNSPKQVQQLLAILRSGDIKSTKESMLKKVALRHPLNSVIINLILDIRGLNKLISTYITPGKEIKGKILYSIVAWGTDTGRKASKASHFWAGLQIQNIPRGDDVKQTLMAEDDFMLYECDLEQAESRDTAYISGDEKLIAAVESDKDFHSLNASAFFGIPYDSIYDDEKKKAKDKALRDLSKRVNHGANYNMGANVLVETMGDDKIREAKRILGLPRMWGLKEVAEYLLATFHRTYPFIAKKYYEYVKSAVMGNNLLVGATGWTRYCFKNPIKDKRALNSYVAHCPQSLNAKKLDIAYMRIFYEVALPNPTNFRLNAQIHDSHLFQVRIGHEHLAHKVTELMHVTIDITSTTGKKYTYTVPAALKAGKDGKGAKYWSDTE